MAELIEVSLDKKGRIMIAADIQHCLGLSPGTTLIVEERDSGTVYLRVQNEVPVLVDKQGVLVVKSTATADLTDAVGHECNHRRL